MLWGKTRSQRVGARPFCTTEAVYQDGSELENQPAVPRNSERKPSAPQADSHLAVCRYSAPRDSALYRLQTEVSRAMSGAGVLNCCEDIVLSHGVGVVDCSWAELDKVRALAPPLILTRGD